MKTVDGAEVDAPRPVVRTGDERHGVGTVVQHDEVTVAGTTEVDAVAHDAFGSAGAVTAPRIFQRSAVGHCSRKRAP